MYKLFTLKVNHSTIGIAVARGNRVARFFKECDQLSYDYYEEIGSVKHLWMVLALFPDYPELVELETFLRKGMMMQVFLLHDGSQDL